MATTATFFGTPRTAVAQISTANTNRDGTGTLVDVMTGASTGTRIDDIEIVATGATTAGVVRLFLNDGTNSRLWKEILVSAITPSTTTAVYSYSIRDAALILASASWKLQAATHNAETFNVVVSKAGDA